MRRSDRPLYEPFTEPERVLHQRLKERLRQKMSEMEALRAELERLRKENQEVAQREAAANQARQREIDAAREAREEVENLREELERIPTNARQYMHPTLRVPESAIVLPNINFEIKTSFLTMVKRTPFEGKPNECPMEHMKEFKEMCDTIADGANLEYVRLKAFR